nr:DUF411 domain-containing protein [Thalassotalea sediminis]
MATNHPKHSSVALTVFKTPTCSCCSKWVDHLKHEKINTTTKDVLEISTLKTTFGIAPQYRSCHTAVSVDGYVFEGHIPAKYIRKFLTEQPLNAIGLSVPAMPVGSPGMEVKQRFMPYNIRLLHKDGTSTVYQHIGRYQEQF